VPVTYSETFTTPEAGDEDLGDLLLEVLPPGRPDPFPHLADLSTDELLQRRVTISGTRVPC